MRNPLRKLFCLVLLGGVSAAYADEPATSMFNFSGFGTLGVAHSSNKDADFVNNVFEAHGAGQSASLAAGVDSKLGLQLTATPSEQITGVVQAIAQQKWNGTYAPALEWANVAWQATPDFDVRVGRVVWPMFVRSESVNVGYSNFSIRASGELAAEMPNTHNDGVDATYKFRTGSLAHALTAFGGHSKVHYGDYFPNTTLDVTHIAGLSDMVDIGAVTVHLAAMHMQYVYTAPGVAPFPVKLPIYSLGAVYDSDTWYTLGDAQLALDPYYGRMESFSLLGGYHLGQFSPYLGYSQFKQATFGPGVPAPLQTPTQSDTILGVRWDVQTSVDVKLQLDSIRTGDVAGSFPISLVFPNNGQQYASFLTHPKANVISVVVDFVF